MTIHSYVEDEKLVIRYCDTGVGIPNDQLDNIFDPFFSTKTVGEGTGLGLSISYSIIEKHEGSISVNSIEGEGTTIEIQLPLSG